MNLRIKFILNAFLALCLVSLLVLLYFQENVNFKWRLPLDVLSLEVVAGVATGFAPVPTNSSVSDIFLPATENEVATDNCYLQGTKSPDLLHKTSSPVNVGLIFCRASSIPSLRPKFERFLHSVLKYSSSSIIFHLLTDKPSVKIASEALERELVRFDTTAKVCIYDVEQQIERSKDLITFMQQYFTARPGTYYSDALFFLSLTFYQFLPLDLDQLVVLDIDTEFKSDVTLLHRHFDRFAKTNLMGMAPELSPVYRHILYSYRNKHKMSLLGEPRGKGFPGFNSGVILMNLQHLRNSSLYEELLQENVVKNLTIKYNFKGHLGDQDFYTLIALEYPDLFFQLPCNWNRQLCQWWRNKGYEDVFDEYFQCDGQVHLYHGNCNTPIPS